MGGAYYYPSNVGARENHGINMTFSGPGGALILVEAGYLPHTNPKDEEGLPGQYLFGGYSVTGSSINQVNLANPAASIWGLYAGASQMVYREGGPGTHQGLGVWGSIGWSPQNTTPLPISIAIGAMYEGLISGRDKDQLALGFWWGGYSNDLTGTPGSPALTNQEVLELTYAIAITPWLYIQPDIQYMFDPAANGTVADALIMGVQTSLNF